MDIITHTLSGIAIGTVITSFSHKGFRNKFGLLTVAGFGAALPDFDAISLWSKFDTTIGRIVGLNHSGKEIYFSKFWYSHHGFLHSFLASVIIAMIVFLFFSLIKSGLKILSIKDLIHRIKNRQLYFLAFIFGFIIHLLEDMPTPSCVWGGVNFLWPSKVYLGGTGEIWWWNNYDIFLIVVGVIILNGLIQIRSQWMRTGKRKITIAIFTLGLTLCLFQIKTREYDFNYTGYTTKFEEFEKKSKEIQRHILGNKLYQIMEKIDHKMPVNF